MSIKVEQLTKIYGKQKALNAVSFETKSNAIIGFLGPNGAGKSTTMKILAGLISASSGTAYINGVDVSKDPLSVKRTLGYLPENNPLYMDMYVREILDFEGGTHNISNKAERIKEIIKQTGLEHEQTKKLHQLSKGYKQRVGLAMCLLNDPDVLILDEPTSGLDPNQILEIRSLIKALGQKKTVLVSTHLMQEVEAICDEVIIINKGQMKTHFSVQEMSTIFPNYTLEEIFVQMTN